MQMPTVRLKRLQGLCVHATSSCAFRIVDVRISKATPVSRSRAWRFDGFRRLWESHANAILIKCRLELVSHGLMHYWAIPVTLNVCLISLQIVAPPHFTNIVARHCPILEILKLLFEQFSLLLRFEIDEGVAKTLLAFEVNWQGDDVV